MGRKDDDFPRETLAERVATTRARQAEQAQPPPSREPGQAESNARAGGMGHGTAGFHRTAPSAPATWVSLSPTRHPPVEAPPPVRHAWYAHPDHGRLPALLLKWRHTGDRRHYDGFICTVVPDETGAWCLAELWVDASMLSPT